MTLKDGQTVVIRGTQSPGGRIELQYSNSSMKTVAADAGDYIYPSDVRLAKGVDLLYVKAAGLAGGINRETWLFEYDLNHRRLLTRKLVSDDALPPECPEDSKR